MPWSISERDGKFCVVKDADGEVEGCHDSREKALAQQRALYANEPGVKASLEMDTTALMEEFFPDPEPQPVRIEVAAAPTEANEALVAALGQLSERLLHTEENVAAVAQLLKQITEDAKVDREATERTLTSALSSEPPVVNVHVPEPVVNVTVPTPEVSVQLPSSRRSIKLERDAFGTISGASVEEE